MGFIANHVKLTQKVIVKAPGLLPMRYKLNEIAEKLDINPGLLQTGQMQVYHTNTTSAVTFGLLVLTLLSGSSRFGLKRKNQVEILNYPTTKPTVCVVGNPSI